MSAQLELRLDWNAIWQEHRQIFRRIVEQIGVKQVAFDLDVSPSQLLNALEERERHMPARWIPYLMAQGGRHGDDYVRRLAGLRGLDVTEAAPPSPEEELVALRAALQEELGSGARAAVLERASVIHAGRRGSKR